MAGNTEKVDGRTARRWRIAAWIAAAFLLLLPLFAMQITDQVAWDVADFAIFGALLVGAGVTCELAVRKTDSNLYRSAVGVAVATAFLLGWVNGAVGIIGSEDNDANLMYVGVLAVGVVGSLMARFQPRGMARAMFAMALAQVLVAVIALIAEWGSMTQNWPRDILGATAVFTILWLMSAVLFRNAAPTEPERGAV